MKVTIPPIGDAADVSSLRRNVITALQSIANQLNAQPAIQQLPTVDLQNNRVTNVADPGSSGDAVNLGTLKRLLAGVGPGSTTFVTSTSSGGGGPTPPGGADTQVQFNKVSNFAGDPNFIWNYTNEYLQITSLSTHCFIGQGTEHNSGINVEHVQVKRDSDFLQANLGAGYVNGNGGLANPGWGAFIGSQQDGNFTLWNGSGAGGFDNHGAVILLRSTAGINAGPVVTITSPLFQVTLGNVGLNAGMTIFGVSSLHELTLSSEEINCSNIQPPLYFFRLYNNGLAGQLKLSDATNAGGADGAGTYAQMLVLSGGGGKSGQVGVFGPNSILVATNGGSSFASVNPGFFNAQGLNGLSVTITSPFTTLVFTGGILTSHT